MAGIAGALFVPIVGIVSPNDVGIVPSIGMLIGVAIGGRTTLFGPALGAIAVAWAGSTLSEQFPSGWTYVAGPAVHAGDRLPARRPRVAGMAATGAGGGTRTVLATRSGYAMSERMSPCAGSPLGAACGPARRHEGPASPPERSGGK